MTKVSVVIPVYNVEDYLEECLESIINQTLKDIEIICINDGSTDNSLKILEDYAEKDGRIKIYSQENSGLSASRNQGIKLSRGEYIYFIDSDDYLELETLQELYVMSKSLDLDILIFKLINFYDDTREKYTTNYYEMSFLKPYEGKIFNFDTIGGRILDIAVSVPGKFFKKSLIFSMKFPEGLIFEDNLFFAEAMLKAKNVSFLDKHFYNRRIRSGSITNTKTIKFADTIIIANRIMDLFKEFRSYDKFKKRLIEKKIYSTFNRFSQVDEVYKEEFFNRIQEDFKNHEKEFKNDELFLKKVRPRFRYIFNAGLDSQDYKDFELKVEIFLQNQISKKLTKKEKKLNSNSWKITKPLRKISGVFRDD